MHSEDRQFIARMIARLGSQFTDAVSGMRRRYGKSVHIRRPGGPAAAAVYVVHHTAGRQVTGLERCLRQSWDYHVRWLGWNTGGYALLIDVSGHVYMVAYPYGHMTYNAGARWNPVTAAVCCIGNFEDAEPPAAMLDSLYKTLASLDDVAYRPWRAHREIRQTACPGKHLLPHVQRMRGGEYGAASPRPVRYP
jgi:hypothetical protein